jgi:peptidyl-prolyl cis-trans isomerase A (cyclophilin A)
VITRAALVAIPCAALASCTCGRAPTAGGIGEDPAPTAITIPQGAPLPSYAPAWVTPMPSPAVPTLAPLPDGGVDGGARPKPLKIGGSDPLEGRFTLADATRGLAGTGALVAHIDTPRGTLDCKLYDDKAPHTVANFVGLARGVRPWRDARGAWRKEPAYDGTAFHRIIRGFVIQGGDPIGDGVGDIGYQFDDEIWPGATHDRAGLLCMANMGKNTNAAQFFVTDGPALHLDSKGYSIFGVCSPISRVHELAAWPVAGEKAIDPPAIARVTITREKP